MTAKIKHLYQFDMLRFLAILGVVMIHATSIIIPLLPTRESFQFWILVFLNQSSRFCVPAFIFISGFFTTYRREAFFLENGKITSFLMKKASRLLIPYLFWSILFLVLSGIEIKDSHSFLLFLWKIVSGRAFWGGYFIISLLQLSIIGIIVLRYFRNSRWLIVFISISIITTEFLYYFGVLGGSTLIARVLRAGIADYRATFLPWLPYYLAGLYLGLHNDQVLPKLMQYKNIYLPVMILFLSLSVIEFTAIINLTNSVGNASEYFRLSSILYSIFVCIFIIVSMPTDISENRIIKLVSDSSYGIFFLNDRLMLGVISIFPFVSWSAIIGSSILFLVGLVIPLSLYYLIINQSFPNWVRLISYGVTLK